MRPSDRAFVILLLAPLSGCAWITQNQAATAEYSRQVMVVSARAAEVEAELADAEARIAQLEEAVRRLGHTESERLETIDQVNAEITSLRGKIEEVTFHVQETQRFLDDQTIERERRMLHAERRLSELEKYLKVKPPPPPTDAELGIARTGDPGTTPTPGTDPTVPTGTQVPPPVVEDPAPATADAALELAVEHMKAGRQAVARIVLQKAIEAHPGAPETPELLYRIAETYFNEGPTDAAAYKTAVKSFDDVVQKYPKSEWAPWAMFRQGDAFESLGQRENAKLFWQSVVDRYPKSTAAKEAKVKLAK